MSSSFTCPLSDGAQTSRSLLRHGGTYYQHDMRLRTLDNTVSAPYNHSSVDVALRTSDLSCPTVTKSFVNQGTCTRAPTCAPLSYTSAPLVLNHTSLRRFYEVRVLRAFQPYTERHADQRFGRPVTQIAGKYVYAIDGLKLESVSGTPPWRVKMLTPGLSDVLCVAICWVSYLREHLHLPRRSPLSTFAARNQASTNLRATTRPAGVA